MREPDGPDDGDTLHVPDDISSLSADVVAFRREESARRRRQRWERATARIRRLRWYGVSVPLVVAGLLGVGGLGALLVLLGPKAAVPTPGSAAPVAGRPGGPLRDVLLTRTDGSTVVASKLAGPAEIVLLPVGCDCAGTVTAVAAAARTAGVAVYAVGLRAADGDVPVLADPNGALLADYGALGVAPTVLRLTPEGLVRSVRTGVTTETAAGAVAAG